MHTVKVRMFGAGLLALLLLLALPSRPAAHEIPPSVTVLVFARPEGETLRLLVRVPLASMRDMEWPLRGPGYLELAQVDSLLRDAAALWVASYLELYEEDRGLGRGTVASARVSLPSDRSFTDYASALQHTTGTRLPADLDLVWNQALLDVLIEYPIASDRARFSIHPGLAHLGIRTTTVLRFQAPAHGERVFQYTGDPGLVRLDPRWHQAAFRFVALGFAHIMEGLDHLLFVFCLVIPFRRFRPLLAVVTSFTVAHSITLIASAAGLAPNALWFPPLIETLIALSIVYMAFENIVGANLQRRWLIAFVFGLVHGFGFSFLLRDSLQFAGSHLATSLLAFNMGVELGQVVVLIVAIPVLNLLFKHVVAERMGTIILSALVAHSAWHWMTDRSAGLSEYDFRWPALDAAFLAGALRVLMLLLVLAGAVWLLHVLFGRYVKVARPEAAELTLDPGGLPGSGRRDKI